MPEHVTGHFASPEAARAALVRLESAGFDADAIDLIGLPPAAERPPDVEQATANDAEALRDAAAPAAAGAGVGAVAGAAAGVVAGLVTGDPGAGVVVGTAAAVGGGVVGGLAGTYAQLPVNEAAWTTHELDPADPHPITVRVRVDDEAAAERANASMTQ